MDIIRAEVIILLDQINKFKFIFMKTKKILWCILGILFPLLVSCNDNDDFITSGYIPRTISLHLDFVDSEGTDLIAPLAVYQIPKGALAEKNGDLIGLMPDDYMLNVYLDGKLVESSKDNYNNLMCLVGDSPLKKGYKSLHFYSSKAEEGIMTDDRYKSSHVIEFKFTCEALFKDSEEHVVRFDFLPPNLDTPVFDYMGKVTLDGKELNVIYPDDSERITNLGDAFMQLGLSVIATL